MSPTTTATCSTCKRDLPPTAPRLVVGGSWLCPDCALLADKPDALIAPRAQRRVRVEQPALFDRATA